MIKCLTEYLKNLVSYSNNELVGNDIIPHGPKTLPIISFGWTKLITALLMILGVVWICLGEAVFKNMIPAHISQGVFRTIAFLFALGVISVHHKIISGDC